MPVLDSSWRTGPAYASDDGDPACSSRLGDRWFFRAEPAGWKPVFESAAGGCGSVRRPVPLSATPHPSHPPAADPPAAGGGSAPAAMAR
ncbi:hypothetical protein [Streptomyces sp. NPDC047841]|uniref:hypothetical protein n=1 Tax=Streptomyces sp. NPDC047841 TaxID=3154708 RepID=UPI003451A4DB